MPQIRRDFQAETLLQLLCFLSAPLRSSPEWRVWITNVWSAFECKSSREWIFLRKSLWFLSLHFSECFFFYFSAKRRFCAFIYSISRCLIVIGDNKNLSCLRFAPFKGLSLVVRRNSQMREKNKINFHPRTTLSASGASSRYLYECLFFARSPLQHNYPTELKQYLGKVAYVNEMILNCFSIAAKFSDFIIFFLT